MNLRHDAAKGREKCKCKRKKARWRCGMKQKRKEKCGKKKKGCKGRMRNEDAKASKRRKGDLKTREEMKMKNAEAKWSALWLHSHAGQIGSLRLLCVARRNLPMMAAANMGVLFQKVSRSHENFLSQEGKATAPAVPPTFVRDLNLLPPEYTNLPSTRSWWQRL